MGVASWYPIASSPSVSPWVKPNSEKFTCYRILEVECGFSGICSLGNVAENVGGYAKSFRKGNHLKWNQAIAQNLYPLKPYNL